MAASGYNRGGLGGYAQWLTAGFPAAIIDFWGARTLESNSVRAGASSGVGEIGGTLKYGGLVVGQIVLTAGGQHAANTLLYPFYRFVGPGSRAGFGVDTWLARGPVGSVPYGSVANAVSKLQIPPQSAVNTVVRARGVWYKYVAGTRVISGNPRWGVGGGLEYRVGGF